MTEHRVDVVVVGGGPGGATSGAWLARAGHRVLVLEKKHYPRDKVCGDGLTPRSIKELADLGFVFEHEHFHKIRGLRSNAFGRTLELDWPQADGYPDWGGCITRRHLDEEIARLAAGAGAEVWEDTEVLEPIVEAGQVRGVTARSKDGAPITIRAPWTVLADGAKGRLARQIGVVRDKSKPMGIALRGYYASPRADDDFIESHLDLRDEKGNILPGYGWIFPLGDGTVNVGVGLLSTFKHYKDVNTGTMLTAFLRQAPRSWELTPENKLSDPVGGFLPMGFATGPVAGAGYLVVGDAGGFVNPFNGEGIAYAMETGRLAAECLSEALKGDPQAALRYPAELHARYGDFYAVGRAFVKLLGQPRAAEVLIKYGIRIEPLMAWTLRVMANLQRVDRPGAGERFYRALETIVKVGPTP